MVKVTYTPERGDVVWINMTPQAGHEQAGRRPAIVLSPSSYNGKVRLAIFCPITTHQKGYPFEVIIPEGYDIKGAILSDQIKSLDWKTRKVEYNCRLPKNIVTKVLNLAKTLL